MSTKFGLNSQVLSKNTTEILNTCIDRIYKQVPATFKNSLDGFKIAKIRPENAGPLKTFSRETIRRQRKQSGVSSKTSSSPKSRNADLLNTVLMMNKKSPLHKLASRTIQKKGSPYKMAGKRRSNGGPSSLSSFSSSFYKRGGNYYYPRASRLRHFYTINPLSNVNYKPKVINSPINLPSIPLREAHTFRNPKDSLNTLLTKTIKNDLMVIDNVMRKRLNDRLQVKSAINPLQMNILELTKRDENIIAEEAIRQQYRYLDENNLISCYHNNKPYQSYNLFGKNVETATEDSDYNVSKIKQIAKEKQCLHRTKPKKKINPTNEINNFDSDEQLSIFEKKQSDFSVKQERVDKNNNKEFHKLKKPYIKIVPPTLETTSKVNSTKLKSNNLVKPTKTAKSTKPSSKSTYPMKSLIYQKGMPSATLISSILNRPTRIHYHY